MATTHRLSLALSLALLCASAAVAQTSPVYDAALEAGASPEAAASLAVAMAVKTETATLRASNSGRDDNFGASVSLSGDRALVGARYEDGPTNADFDSGAAYVFDLSGGTWTEAATLRASNAGAGDSFGYSVSLSGDRALVGALGEDGPGNAEIGSGAAYVFDLLGGTWTETAILRASNAGRDDEWGGSVSLSGDRALVGAIREDGPAHKGGLTDSGAAYVFDFSGGTWTETAILRASNSGRDDNFGASVSLSGDRALVGAIYEDGPTNATDRSGAAYVFDLLGGTWTETAILRASNAGRDDYFGASVSLSGDRALVGADRSGAAYVFDLSGGTWTETTILRASNAGGGFGAPVSLSGDRALVGARYEDDPTNADFDSGAAYVFDLSGGTWTETAILRASNRETEDFFGASASLSGDRALMGALGEDGPTNATDRSGAAYVFLLGTPPVANDDELAEAGARLVVENPARGAVSVRFDIRTPGAVTLTVYDAVGRQVAILAEGDVPAGEQTATLDAGTLASGVYIVRLDLEGGTLTRVLTVVR